MCLFLKRARLFAKIWQNKAFKNFDFIVKKKYPYQQFCIVYTNDTQNLCSATACLRLEIPLMFSTIFVACPQSTS